MLHEARHSFKLRLSFDGLQAVHEAHAGLGRAGEPWPRNRPPAAKPRVGSRGVRGYITPGVFVNVQIHTAPTDRRHSANGEDSNPGALQRDRTSDSREIFPAFTQGRSDSTAPATFSASRSRVYSFETDALPPL